MKKLLINVGDELKGFTVLKREGARVYASCNTCGVKKWDFPYRLRCRHPKKNEIVHAKVVPVLYEHNGESKTLSGWASHKGISRQLLHDRIKRGWTLARAIDGKVSPYHTRLTDVNELLANINENTRLASNTWEGWQLLFKRYGIRINLTIGDRSPMSFTKAYNLMIKEQ